MADDTDEPQLKGVGGWLGFLVVILGIISPIRLILETAINLDIDTDVEQMLGPNWPAYQIITWIIAAITVGGVLLLAYRLVYVRRHSTIGFVIKGLWVLALAPLLLDLVISSIMFPQLSDSLLVPSLLGDIAKSAIFATIWSLYLAKSRRVANTYVVDETEAKRIFG